MANKMTLTDLLSFAKAGWKPSDVKELIEASKALDSTEAPKADTPTEPPKDAPQDKPEEKAKTEETPAKETGQPEGADDFEAKYKELDAKYKSLQDKLNNLDVSTPNTGYNDLLDIVKTYC